VLSDEGRYFDPTPIHQSLFANWSMALRTLHRLSQHKLEHAVTVHDVFKNPIEEDLYGLAARFAAGDLGSRKFSLLARDLSAIRTRRTLDRAWQEGNMGIPGNGDSTTNYRSGRST